MRTTLTIDDDVAAELERLRKARDAGLKDLVNEALRLGLVSEVVPASDLMTRVKALAATIASKSPVALRYIKEALRASVRSPMDAGLALERTLFGLVFASDDKVEGVEAFLQKRKPDFKGA